MRLDALHWMIFEVTKECWKKPEINMVDVLVK